jgi:RHS repeat-associated protein
VLTSNQFDFKGNLVSSTLRLLESYRDEVDWRAEPVLADEEFTTAARYDALNRPVELTTPDGSVTTPIYDAANKLDRLLVRLRGALEATVFIDHIAYTAKGQREAIEYGNGVRTDYHYDPLTARLRRLRTVRRGDGAVLQDLGYTRDPMSNTTRLADRAQQTIFFDNAVVSPAMEFVYDALYRLTEARGREHPGQIGSPQPTPDDSPRTNHPLPNQGDVMQRYVERYSYDAVGNLSQMAHAANSGSWTRHYAYDAGSNRLRSTSVPGDPAAGPYSAVYDHDQHGNITRMPHLARMDWNALDQLRRVELGGGGEVFYTYNASGMRVRKVVERRDGSRQERIYLGGYEIYRERRGDRLELERQSLHVLDLEERVALVETTTVQDGAPLAAPAAVTRYQLDNEQRSSCLELDGRGRILSYEEYYPFGGTSYQAVDRSIEVSRKRYRYLGKERDSETGLSYCLARYYAPWLGRWVSCDPAGFADGTNVYAYSRNNPIRYTDPSGTEADEEKPEQLLDVLKHLGISTDRGDPGASSGGLFGAIGDLFSAIWSGIKTVAGAIGGAIATAASAVWTWTKGAVSAAWEWLKGAASAAWEWTKNAVSAAWNWLKGAVSAAWEWTKNAVSAVWNWTKDAVSAAWEWTKSAATAAWNWTKQAVTDAWNWTKQAVSDAWEWTKNAAAAVWDWTKRAAAILWKGFKAVVAFTWNWILAPLIRTATNAAAGFLVGGVAGAIVGGIMGAAHGFAMAYAESYDWGSFGGWAEFLADNTWSLPNSVVGSLFATLNLIGGNSVDDATSKDTGELYFSGQWFSPFDTTLGNVTVGTVVPEHERTHALQARLFGPLFYPLVLANYVVATVLPYWVFYHDFAAHPIKSIGDYFKCGVYPHTWHEEWAYSVQGGVC